MLNGYFSEVRFDWKVLISKISACIIYKVNQGITYDITIDVSFVRNFHGRFD